MVSTQRAEGYGPFPGGDPRRFSPDREICTKEEIERWEAACQRWRDGNGVDTGPQCQVFGDSTEVSGEGFGLGMFDFGEMADDEAIETIGQLEAEIARLRAAPCTCERYWNNLLQEYRTLSRLGCQIHEPFQ